MTTPAKDDGWALTEREKQTLRLIVRGHDAKSIARTFDLSVHTINERLRDARRKMGVSSSREAARLLLDAEGDATSPAPEKSADERIGADGSGIGADQATGPVDRRLPIILFSGVLLMMIILAFLALAGSPPAASPTPVATSATVDAQVVDAAQRFLTLVDQGRWDESYRAFGKAFRRLNTARVWADTSEKQRVPLGAAVSRTFVSQENLPAPPRGYEVVKFRTHFANKADTIETVSLDREDGVWRVVGVMID